MTIYDDWTGHVECVDGDKKAYSESSQWTIRQNKDIISQLRHENKMLRVKLSRKMKVSGSAIVHGGGCSPVSASCIG